MQHDTAGDELINLYGNVIGCMNDINDSHNDARYVEFELNFRNATNDTE